MFNYLHRNILTTFLDSLSYKEAINLRVTLLKSQHLRMSKDDASAQATIEFLQRPKPCSDMTLALKSDPQFTIQVQHPDD
ncbi:MAG: hypothetical protein ABF534_13905 [Lacticaseibacillus paracasei]